MTVIHKTTDDYRVAPNLADYQAARASFAWSELPELCAGMPTGHCNIAYAAVDRHAEGPSATRTALRFITDETAGGALATYERGVRSDLSPAGRWSASANQRSGCAPSTAVFASPPWCRSAWRPTTEPVMGIAARCSWPR